MRQFEYGSAATLDEALRELGNDGEVRPLAGGTDLLTLMKADLFAPRRVIDVKRVPEMAAGVREAEDGLEVGALTTLADLETHPVVRERYAALAEAAAVAATPQLRNVATIGGNLLQRPRCWYFRNRLFHCWLKGGAECQARDGENGLHALFDGGSPCVAVHPSDLAPALVALDASVRLRGPGGERVLPVERLFAVPSEDRRTETALGPDELVVALRVPAAAGRSRSTYLKAMDRKVWAFALVGVAAALRVDGGKIAAARLVLSGVAPIPWRVPAAERALVGQAPEDRRFADAAEAALAGAQPLSHNRYKVTLARALVRRALAAVTGT